MADRFIIHGATYNGDGTTSAEAASGGAAGAWNSLIYAEGTAPPAGSTLPAGTVVYIRSKDAAGADISRSFAVAKSIGSSAATTTSNITWVVDDGTVWSGVSGTITYKTTAAVAFTIVAYNALIASNYNLIFAIDVAGAYNNYTFVSFLDGTTTKDVKIDMSACTSNGGPVLLYLAGAHYRPWFRSTKRYRELLEIQAFSNIVFFDPNIELLDSGVINYVFSLHAAYSSSLIIYGGALSGVGVTTGSTLIRAGNTGGQFASFGFKFPQNIKFSKLNEVKTYASAIGADGSFGAMYADEACMYDSRNDGYYPVVDAVLPDSNDTKWSYKFYPCSTKQSNPARIVMGKLFTQADSTRTLTVRFLWANSIAFSPTKDIVFIIVSYKNPSGATVSETTKTKTADAVATSTAPWSYTTYFGNPFTKYECSLTTTQSVMQDTEIVVSFVVIRSTGGESDVIFVDPDVGLV